MSLTAFIQAVCAQCGVALTDSALDGLPNGSYQIAAFYADGLTGRQLIQWAAQAACRFRPHDARRQADLWLVCRLCRGGRRAGDRRGGADGAEPGGAAAGHGGRGYLDLWAAAAGYLSGALSYEDYETAPIDKVQIRQSDDDVGVIYPPDETGTNALVLQGNLLLTTATAEALQPVAQAIFETMQGVSYTPLTVSVQAADGLTAPGSIVMVTDAYGRQMQTYIMSRTISGQKVTLESTGNARRDSTAAVNSQKWSNLQGKMPGDQRRRGRAEDHRQRPGRRHGRRWSWTWMG